MNVQNVVVDSTAVIRGQVDRLLTVLTNVLLNALDAAVESSTGSGEIQVSTDTEGDNVVVRIREPAVYKTESRTS